MKIFGRQVGMGARAQDAKDLDYMEHTRMSFGDHLEELRIRLMLALLGVAVGGIIGLLAGKTLLGLIFQPQYAVLERHHLPQHLLGSTPQAGFSVYMKVGLLSGVILAGPWILYQAWQFVCSGLYPREQNFVRRFMPASAGLFVAGVLFMYFVALPIVLNFFVAFNKSFSTSYGGMTSLQRLLLGGGEDSGANDGGSAAPQPSVEAERAVRVPMLDHDPADPKPGDMWFNSATRKLNIQDQSKRYSTALTPADSAAMITGDFTVDSYTSFVLMMALAFGLAFQLPIAVVFLAWTGIVSAEQMGKSRRIVILVIFIVAAVLTPPDVFSQCLLAVPMLGLFEFGLWLARLRERRSATPPAP